MAVSLPAGLKGADARAFVDGREVAARVKHRVARFVLPADGGKPVDWAITG
jgi:hypothetical protein